MQPAEVRTMTLRDLYLVLRARWRVVALIAGLVILASIVISLVLPKQYTGTASVVIDAKSDPVQAVAATALTEQLLQSYVTTEVDIIGSQRVALRVVKQLGLENDPDLRARWEKSRSSWFKTSQENDGDIKTWIANYLLERKLRVAPSRDSNVINIAAKWSSPAGAASLANAFAAAAIETNIELRVEPAKQYAAWFNERSTALRADLAAKQKRLSDFQTKAGIVATDDKLDVENARLAELSSELVTVQGQLQETQSRQRQLGKDYESLPEVLQNTVIGNLKSDLSDAEAKEADIAARVGKNHPDYQSADATVQNLRARLEQETEKIGASLGNANQVNVRRELELRRALDAQKDRVLELRHKHDEASILEGDVVAAQRDLDAVTQRLAQSSLESQAQQTNIVQLTYAVAPLEHSSPKLLLNVALGILFGGILGLATALVFELKDRRIRHDGEIEELLGVPLLATIGKIEVKDLSPQDLQQLQHVI